MGVSDIIIAWFAEGNFSMDLSLCTNSGFYLPVLVSLSSSAPRGHSQPTKQLSQDNNMSLLAANATFESNPPAYPLRISQREQQGDVK